MNPSEWACRITFEDGNKRYVKFPGYSFTTAPGNSQRFESENAALHHGYTIKENNKRIVDVEAIEIKNPRKDS
jgi:hypothetical protein